MVHRNRVIDRNDGRGPEVQQPSVGTGTNRIPGSRRGSRVGEGANQSARAGGGLRKSSGDRAADSASPAGTLATNPRGIHNGIDSSHSRGTGHADHIVSDRISPVGHSRPANGDGIAPRRYPIED